MSESQEELYIPNQAFLTALIQIFPAIFQHIHKRFIQTKILNNSFNINFSYRFSKLDFEYFCTVLTNVVSIPVQSENVPFIVSSMSDSLLTPLHDSILECMELIIKVYIHIFLSKPYSRYIIIDITIIFK